MTRRNGDDEAVELAVVSTAEDFERLAPEWNALVRCSELPCPYQLHGWLAERWRVFEPSAEIVIARRDDRLTAALALGVRERLGLRIGSFLSGVFHGTDLLLDRSEPLTTAAVVADCARRLPLDFAGLWGFRRGAVVERVLGSGLRPFQWGGAPVLELPDGWEAAYREKRSSKSRNQHRRKLRKLNENGRVSFEVARTATELEDALEIAFRLHASRWASHPRIADRSGFTSAEGQDFHRAALARLAADDVARIIVLRAGGRPLAFVLYFVLERGMWISRLAFDPREAEASPGTLAVMAAIEEAASEGATRVDFGVGLERYKLELCDRVEPALMGTALAGTVKGKLAASARVGFQLARRKLDRGIHNGTRILGSRRRPR